MPEGLAGRPTQEQLQKALVFRGWARGSPLFLLRPPVPAPSSPRP